MMYALCPNYLSNYSGRIIWECSKCGKKGCESSEIFGSGSGCWNSQSKNSCCNSNYKNTGYID